MKLTQKQLKKVDKICLNTLNMGSYSLGTFVKYQDEIDTYYLHIVFDPLLVPGNFVFEGVLERLHEAMESELKLKFGVFWIGFYRGEYRFTDLPLELHFWAVIIKEKV